MKYLVCLGILFGAFVANAQFFSSVGFKSGATFSNQNWKYITDYSLDTEVRTSFQWAFMADAFSSKYFALNLEFGRIEKGMTDDPPFNLFKTTTTYYSPPAYQDYRYDYVYLSTLAKFKYPLGNFTPYGLIGPRLDYMTQKIIPYDAVDANDINDVILGLNFGLGVSYKIKRISFCIEAEQQWDLSKFANEGKTLTNKTADVKNTALLLSFGISYHLHQKE